MEKIIEEFNQYDNGKFDVQVKKDRGTGNSWILNISVWNSKKKISLIIVVLLENGVMGIGFSFLIRWSFKCRLLGHINKVCDETCFTCSRNYKIMKSRKTLQRN